MTQTTRNHRIKSHYGGPAFYRFFKKKYPDSEVSGIVYAKIIKEFNSFVRDSISKKGNPYHLPAGIGIVELRKKKVEITFNEDGTMKNTLPVNWRETRQLWDENEKAKEKKIKIRFVNQHSNGYTFKIVYLRSSANYKNKSIYRIRFNRQMKRQLSKSIFENKIEAFVN